MKTLIKEQPMDGGVQKIYQFDNGYQASVVKSPYTYGGPEGLWEVAIIHNGLIDYTTPITSGVVGYLDDNKLEDTLNQIEQLPKKG